MKNKRFLYTICLVIVCLGVLSSLAFRLSYKPSQYSGDDMKNFSISLSPLTADDYDESQEIQYLSSDPDIIVSGVFLGDREFQNGVSLSKIKVEKVYKGDIQYLESEIYVYEPISLITKANVIINYGKGYVPMIKDKEYILLLDHKQFPAEKRLAEKDEKTFSLFNFPDGLFCFSKLWIADAGYIANDADQNYTMDKLVEYEILTEDEDTYHKFYNIKQALFEKYEIQ